jgi:hypothetical protein
MFSENDSTSGEHSNFNCCIFSYAVTAYGSMNLSFPQSVIFFIGLLKFIFVFTKLQKSEYMNFSCTVLIMFHRTSNGPASDCSISCIMLHVVCSHANALGSKAVKPAEYQLE